MLSNYIKIIFNTNICIYLMIGPQPRFPNAKFGNTSKITILIWNLSTMDTESDYSLASLLIIFVAIICGISPGRFLRFISADQSSLSYQNAGCDACERCVCPSVFMREVPPSFLNECPFVFLLPASTQWTCWLRKILCCIGWNKNI